MVTKEQKKNRKSRSSKIQSAQKAEEAPAKSRRTTLMPQKPGTHFRHGTKSWWFGKSFLGVGLPYRQHELGISFQGLEVGTCVSASHTCLCNWCARLESKEGRQKQGDTEIKPDGVKGWEKEGRGWGKKATQPSKWKGGERRESRQENRDLVNQTSQENKTKEVGK